MKILLLTKSTPWCHLVQEVLRKSEHDVTVVEDLGLEYPRQHYFEVPWRHPGLGHSYFDTDFWTGDLIVSYLYPRVLTEKELARAPRAINFHPAPPWHPGFAPYSWAIYENTLQDEYGDYRDYGVTVHAMKTKVDTGPILRAKTFEIRRDDSVAGLQHRTMRHLFAVFVTMMQEGFPWYSAGNDLWLKAPATKAEFEGLRKLDLDMDNAEIKARIRACRYPGQPGAYFEGEEA